MTREDRGFTTFGSEARFQSLPLKHRSEKSNPNHKSSPASEEPPAAPPKKRRSSIASEERLAELPKKHKSSTAPEEPPAAPSKKRKSEAAPEEPPAAPLPEIPVPSAEGTDRPPEKLPRYGVEVPCIMGQKTKRAERPLDGLITLLTTEYGGNVHETNVVNVTGSSQYQNDPHFHAKNATDLMTNDLFYSEPKKNQWICYDFKGMQVCITHYSIRSAADAVPRDWVAEGSVDGSKWFEMDKRQDDDSLSIRTFEVSYNGPIRMF
jgi:hypothetical protein